MQKEWLLWVRFCTELKQTVLNLWHVKTWVSAGWSKWAFSPPCKLGLRTKFSRKRDVSSSIPIKWFISCNDSLLAGTTIHTAQRRTSERYFTKGYGQEHNDARWGPGQEANLAPQCLNLRSFCAAVEEDNPQFQAWLQKNLAWVLSSPGAQVWRTSYTPLS